MAGVIKRVAMLILKQPDIPKAVDFYQQLGLRPIFHLSDKWAELELGSIKIGLCPTGQAIASVHTGIVLEVDDLHQLYATRKGAIPFITEPQEKMHGIMASVQDPGGNVLDLYQPTPDKIKAFLEKVEKDSQVQKDV